MVSWLFAAVWRAIKPRFNIQYGLVLVKCALSNLAMSQFRQKRVDSKSHDNLTMTKLLLSYNKDINTLGDLAYPYIFVGLPILILSFIEVLIDIP